MITVYSKTMVSSLPPPQDPWYVAAATAAGIGLAAFWNYLRRPKPTVIELCKEDRDLLTRLDSRVGHMEDDIKAIKKDAHETRTHVATAHNDIAAIRGEYRAFEREMEWLRPLLKTLKLD